MTIYAVLCCVHVLSYTPVLLSKTTRQVHAVWTRALLGDA
jgi:hypothetical protein